MIFPIITAVLGIIVGAVGHSWLAARAAQAATAVKADVVQEIKKL